jgi:hypothetical protein
MVSFDFSEKRFQKIILMAAMVSPSKEWWTMGEPVDCARDVEVRAFGLLQAFYARFALSPWSIACGYQQEDKAKTLNV